MTKSIKIIAISIFSILIFLNTAQVSTAALFKDLGTVAGQSGAGYDTSKKDPTGIIGTVIGTILSFLGVIFLILMIYGGFLWMTAAGNEEQTKKARSVITAAVIGIIIVASAYAITALVGETIL